MVLNSCLILHTSTSRAFQKHHTCSRPQQSGHLPSSTTDSEINRENRRKSCPARAVPLPLVGRHPEGERGCMVERLCFRVWSLSTLHQKMIADDERSWAYICLRVPLGHVHLIAELVALTSTLMSCFSFTTRGENYGPFRGGSVGNAACFSRPPWWLFVWWLVNTQKPSPKCSLQALSPWPQ